MTRSKLLMGLILFFFAIADSWSMNLSVCADEWYPVNGRSAKAPGYGLELAREIFKAHNVVIEYREMPWKTALEKAKTGECDAIIGASKYDTPIYHYPVEPIGVVRNYLYVKKENPWRYTGLASLAQIRLGIIDTYFYDKEFNSYIDANRNSHHVVVSSAKEGIEGLVWRLLYDKVDVLIEANIVMQAKLREKELTESIIPAGAVGKDDEIYLAFSLVAKDANQWATWFDAGIQELRSNGNLTVLLKRYGLEDWKK